MSLWRARFRAGQQTAGQQPAGQQTAGQRTGGRIVGLATSLAVVLSLVSAPSAVAWAATQQKAPKVWNPPKTPLGADTGSVPGTDLKVVPLPPMPGHGATGSEPVKRPPLKTGTAVLTLGPDSAEAKAARAATGGAAPASSGATFARAGELPVRLAPTPDSAEPVREARVSVTDKAAGRSAGVDAPLVAVSAGPTARPGAKQDVRVSLDLSAWQAAGWADRTRLVALPACALTTPNLPECRKQTPVQATVDPAAATITADVTLPAASDATGPAAKSAAPTAESAPSSDSAAAPAAVASAESAALVLAADTAAGGSGGTYAATSLNPSMAWSAGSNVGNFTYSYPIHLPPALGGAAPAVSLDYNSAAVDGRTSATNSQASWIGDGWGYEPGFIERSYRPCDKAGIAKSGDLCWGGQNASLALAGHSGALVRDDATGVWHIQGDDGSKVEQLTGAGNGTSTGEYWKVSTRDGMEYYFGLNHLPGGDGTDPASNSALTVPVYSPNSGDPCNSAATGAGSWCTMGWRWQLDYAVDTHRNLTTYSYAPETNSYNRGGGQNGGNGTLTAYQREATLSRIAYGQRLPEQIAAKGGLKPAAAAVFTTVERCLPTTGFACAESDRTTANASSWPDVPLDQACAASGSCLNTSPTFFSTKRLTTITTQVTVNGAPVTVDKWDLGQSFFDPGDGTAKTLWLDSVTRTGSDGRAEAKLPAVSFSPMPIANRIDGLDPPQPKFIRPRISQITTETGGRILVNYSTAECSRVNHRMPASADGNTMACMPVKWYKPGVTDPVDDWFDKPLVTSVSEQDAVTGVAVTKTATYTYNGGAAWHRNDAEFTDPKTRTWDNFRGYQSVTTTTGSAYPGEAPKTQQTITYLRGMDGDYLADNKTKRSVQVASPLGGTVTDSDWLAGGVVATEGFDQAGGQVLKISGTVSEAQTTTATHKQSGGMPDLLARYPAAKVTSITKSKLSDGSWRTTTSVATSDPANGNRVLSVADQGDGTAATPATCTTNTYATSSNPLLSQLIAQTAVTSGPCGVDPGPGNTVSASRTFYDGKPYKQAGDVGDATSSQILDRYDGANPVYALNGTTTRDAYGRITGSTATDGSTYDANGGQLTGASVTPAPTSTAFTPAGGELAGSVATTSPMGAGWTTTITVDPGRGVTTASTDLNGRTTTQQYDGLGRLTAVWTPERPTNLSPSRRFSYDVNGVNGPSVITTEWLKRTGNAYSGQRDLYDGLGRLRQTQRTSDARQTGRLITDTVYDSHGWAIKTSAPYYEATTAPNSSIYLPEDSQVPSQTWNTYDGLGRVVRTESRSYGNLQWATLSSYPGAERVDTTPPDGATAGTSITDARGRVVASWQYRTATPTGNPADADVSTFTYTPGGQPATRTDSSGNTWRYTYDQRGRPTSVTDPDTGTSRTFYDANSRIDHTTDARGSTLAYTYDLIGRKTGLYSGSVAPANQLAAWTFDTLAKGLPTSSTRYVGGANGTAYTKAVTGYDAMDRPLGSSVTIPAGEGALAGTFTTTNTYYPYIGTLKTTDLPAAGGLPAETVYYSYTDTGLLQTANTADDTLVADVSYDALSRPVRTVVGPPGLQTVNTTQYDWATGRVINSFLDRQNGNVAVDQAGYTYTASGRLTSVSTVQDAQATDTQCFSYDYLGRLTQAWTDTGATHTTADWTDSSGVKHGSGSSTTVPGIGGCDNANGPATTAGGGKSVGGPSPYWQSYGYDATGNRTGLVQHDVTGNTANDVTTTQAFGAAKSVNTPTTAPSSGGGTGGPHALTTSTTSSAAGTRTVGYQYDAAGNTTAITDTSGTTSLTWNGEDKLASDAQTGKPGATSYLYDADGDLLIRRNPGQTTLSLATDQLTLDTASGATTNTRYFGAPGGLALTRVTAAIGGGTLLVQASDPHGTANLQINTTEGMAVTRRPVDPFGNPRGTQPDPGAWAGQKGFVGGLKDDTTGLTNLGAREYDPRTGRFLNPDPLLDVANPQQWNGYAYSDNDPVNLSDPTGLIVDDCWQGGCGHGHYSPRAPEPVMAPASFCVTLECAQQTSTADYWDNSRKTQAKIATTVSNGNGHGGSQPKKKPGCLKRLLGCLWDHRADIAGAVVSGVTYFGCYTAAGLAAPETGGASLVAGVAGCGAAAGAAGTAAHNLMSPKNKQQSPLTGAVDGAGSALVGEGAVTLVGQLAKAFGPKAGELLEGLVRGCSTHSFPAGTLVLLADGSTKPIEQVAVADQVASTDPQTGEHASKAVTATIVTPDDRHFTDLTLTAAAGADLPKLTVTAHHPFWDLTARRWVDAAELPVGHQVLTADGTTATVVATAGYDTAPRTAYDLTVADLHTYYVLAGATPVLVHNNSEACPVKPVNLPGWRNINVKMEHILDGHTAGGTRYQQSNIKTKFPDEWSPKKIESTVRKAYKGATMAGPSQGPRVFLRGKAEGLEIEMWVNKETREIETAYPVWR
ncbi:polymorphic toxin-type HINT domain-containing protein [Kitasatospora sp. NPDC097643]|uniref:polymorphic toxin-type HINT domain-containing protein n=1 Tax=Kitasatospora sp. NPDC097643 TaxID=3157230 RepID=UPI003323F29A